MTEICFFRVEDSLIEKIESKTILKGIAYEEVHGSAAAMFDVSYDELCEVLLSREQDFQSVCMGPGGLPVRIKETCRVTVGDRG